MRKHSFTLNFAEENFYLETDSEVINQLVSEYFSKHLSEEDSFSARIELLEKKIFSPLPSSARLMLRYFTLKIFQAGGWSYFTDFSSYLLVAPEGKNALGYISSETLKKDQGKFFTAIFLSFVIFELLRYQGVFFLHCAGLVSPKGKIYLFPASSRQGKSTITVYLIQQGFKCLSDDTIFICQKNQEFNFYGFHKPCHLPVNLFQKLSNAQKLSPQISREDKIEIDLEELFPQSKLPSAKGEVVLIFPELKNQPQSRLQPLSKTQALVKLMEQSPFFYLNSRLAKIHLKTLSELVNNSQLWLLENGSDWLEQPEILLELVEKAEQGWGYEAGTS